MSAKPKLDLSALTNIEIDGIDTKDYPDFCDAYISYAEHYGIPLTESELDELNNNHSAFVHEKVWEKVF